MATEELHFTKAPIVEALIGIDLQDKLPDASQLLMSTLADQLAADYPIREDIIFSEVKIEVAKAVDQIKHHMGYFAKSADGLKVVHLRRDNFAYSRLAPYANWEEFRAEAFRLWSIYRSAIGPLTISNFHVRYINRLTWPVESRIEDYLQFYPNIPPGLPQTITGCYMQVPYPLQKPYQGQFMQRLFQVPSPGPTEVSFVLDHDLIFSAVGLNDNNIWSGIDQCRELKNQYFLASITDKMKEILL